MAKRKCKAYKMTRAGRRCASYGALPRGAAMHIPTHAGDAYIDTTDPAQAIEESILDTMQAIAGRLAKKPRSRNLRWAQEDIRAAHQHWKDQDYFGALAYLKQAARLTAK